MKLTPIQAFGPATVCLPAHEPIIGARTAMSARTAIKELADKAVRAPVGCGFMVPLRDFGIVEAAHEPRSSRREAAPSEFRQVSASLRRLPRFKGARPAKSAGWSLLSLLVFCHILRADALTAVDDSAATFPNTAIVVAVLTNDLVSASNQTAILQVTQPSHGRVVINSLPTTNAGLASLVQFAAAQLSNTVAQIADPNSYPRATQPDGSWGTRSASDWTSGFFPGALWNLYELSGDSNFRNWAESWTAGIASQASVTDTDDLGFMINNSFGAGYRLTGNPAYQAVELQAAQSVVSIRYNPVVGCIGDSLTTNTLGVIIDSMMNLELLFRAAAWGNDTNLYAMAFSHAERTMLDFVRPDGGNYHGIIYDSATGAVLDQSWRAAASADSTWARGHAWGTYGFSMAYRETGDTRFLHTAQRMADYYLTNVPPDSVPYWDFQDPAIPNAPKDSSAAAITFSALMELSQLATNLQDRARYWSGAQQILDSLSSSNYLAQGPVGSGILLHATGEFPPSDEVDVSLIYADYYFIEALKRCQEIYSHVTITYIPDTNFYGNDTFTYQVCDSSGASSTATVTVTVGLIAQISLSPVTHWPTIFFPSSAGRNYFVQYLDSLGPGASWNVLATNISSSGAVISITDTNPPARRFYRVGVE